MVDKIIKSMWPFPNDVWKWFFKNSGNVVNAAFKEPSYEVVRVSEDYMLVKVPKKNVDKGKTPGTGKS